MSAARLCTIRPASLIALAAMSLIAGCTEPTPGYCTRDTDCDTAHGFSAGAHCETTIHTCKPNTAVDANDASAGDSPTDTPIDTASNEDHPASTDGPDGARSDAPDASADLFHGCVDRFGCPDPSKPVCQTDGGVCVGCLQNTDCKTAGAPACDTAVKRCIECVVNGDCTDPTKPVCDKQACRRCVSDSECAGIGPGVCMFHLDGHCATDSETVYVSSSTGCADKTDAGTTLGTSQTPYCTPQYAIDSTIPQTSPVDAGPSAADGGADADGGTGVLASAKTLVVMRGGAVPLSQWSFNYAARTISVVGQLGATIAPGANIGIHISAGTVYMRSLAVSHAVGQNPGIVADGNSVLHLDRSIVSDNNAGGILIDGAAYDITNTVIANNSASTMPGQCGAWAGICIRNEASGTLRRFLNNTVVGNKQVGVACSDAYPLQGSIISGNADPQYTNCAFMPCCTSATVNLDSSYHLLAGSSCIDQLQPNISTAYDFDGTPRPIGTMSDCGAFEYVAP